MTRQDRTGQVWQDTNGDGSKTPQLFLVVGPPVPDEDTLDTIHPIFNLDLGEYDTWFEFDMMPWEDECEMERVL